MKAWFRNLAEKLKLKKILPYVLLIGGLGGCFVLALAGSMVVPRPVESFIIRRDCDFVTIGGDFALCTDATKWHVRPWIEEMNLASSALDSLPTGKGTFFLDNKVDKQRQDTYLDQRIEVPSKTRGEPDTTEAQQERTVIGESMTIRYSYYNPALGGPNCLTFVNGRCVSNMANGQPWEPYLYQAVACPKEWAFGTTITLDGFTWTCKDRGGMIKFVDGVPWVDFLRKEAAYPYGTEVQAVVKFKE